MILLIQGYHVILYCIWSASHYSALCYIFFLIPQLHGSQFFVSSRGGGSYGGSYSSRDLGANLRNIKWEEEPNWDVKSQDFLGSIVSIYDRYTIVTTWSTRYIYIYIYSLYYVCIYTYIYICVFYVQIQLYPHLHACRRWNSWLWVLCTSYFGFVAVPGEIEEIREGGLTWNPQEQTIRLESNRVLELDHSGIWMDMVDVWLFRTRWFKVPFSSLAGGHLTPWKGHLIITKRSLWITRNTFFTEFLAVNHPPIGSMYGIFTYIYHKNQPNVGKYTIHGWYGSMLTNKDFYQQHPAVQAMSDEEAEAFSHPESCSSEHREVTGWVFFKRLDTWAIRLSKVWIFTEFIAYSEWSFVLVDFIL